MDTATIRDDTTERHIAKYANKNRLHRVSLRCDYDAIAEAPWLQRVKLARGCEVMLSHAEIVSVQTRFPFVISIAGRA